VILILGLHFGLRIFFFEELHYPKSAAFKIYWLLPGKDLSDGLRIIAEDKDTMVMASVVNRHRNLVVYFDHDNNFAGINWDDIVS